MLISTEQANRLVQRVREGTAIFIDGNVPSQKNSKQILRKRTNIKEYCPHCKKFLKTKTIPFIASSKLTLKYKEVKEVEYLKSKRLFKKLTKGIKPPYVIGYFIIRDSKRGFDYTNISEAPQDIFTKLGFWDDDKMVFNIPIFLGYHVSKPNAGLIIVILNNKVTIEI